MSLAIRIHDCYGFALAIHEGDAGILEARKA